uniref:Uncharacterized protein n=1 Tax=Rangifer tarandus platyrhynchus TaxID=3082113 RepID=A0ACB0EMV4_RANTA|nr:unnamed protein product [Rangifer tarandus platyrhynchus]
MTKDLSPAGTFSHTRSCVHRPWGLHPPAVIQKQNKQGLGHSERLAHHQKTTQTVKSGVKTRLNSEARDCASVQLLSSATGSGVTPCDSDQSPQAPRTSWGPHGEKRKVRTRAMSRCTAGAGRDVQVPGDGWPSHIGACGSHRNSPVGWAGRELSTAPSVAAVRSLGQQAWPSCCEEADRDLESKPQRLAAPPRLTMGLPLQWWAEDCPFGKGDGKDTPIPRCPGTQPGAQHTRLWSTNMGQASRDVGGAPPVGGHHAAGQPGPLSVPGGAESLAALDEAGSDVRRWGSGAKKGLLQGLAW